ncbi:MAG: tetratricopeptide repeat protein [Deltaproteobacteria bacterium]|nr:tetratricopeptide repeat protein [Deltaproteobacteria bacterium]
MKRLVCLLCAFACCSSAWAGAPDLDAIRLTALDGKEVSFGSQRAEVTVVQFWATWCIACMAEMPFVEALWKRYQGDKNVAVLSVKVEFGDAESSLGATRKQVSRYRMPVLIDHEMRLIRYFQPGVKTPGSQDEAMSMQLPMLVILDSRDRAHRFFGFEMNSSVEDYIAKKSKIIELARGAELPAEEPKESAISEEAVRAFMLLEMGKPGEAERLLVEAIAKNPSDPELLLALGSVYEKTGQLGKATRTARRVLALQPESAAAMHLMGCALAARGEKLDEAEAWIRKASKRDPKDGPVLCSLGRVLYLKGELEESRSVLERALALCPDSAEIHARLGETYLKLGQCEKAVAEYRQALEACERAAARPRRIRLGH